jgi:uncharacterized protein
MIALALAVLAASFAGSLHCAAMCGGLVAFAASNGKGQIPYHLGRLGSYGALGAIAGTIGGAIDLAGSSAGVFGAAAAIAGLLMIGWGALALAKSYGLELSTPSLSRVIGPLAFRLHAFSARRSAPARGFIVGGATGLIPCGWLYAFVTTAAGTGSTLGGLTVMAVFWLGTVPALFGIGIAGSRLGRSPRFGAALVMAVGLISLATRIDAANGMAHGSHQVRCHDDHR